MLKYTVEISGYEELKSKTWCCEQVFENLEKSGKEDEFVGHMETIFDDGLRYGESLPTLTEINDYIRFDCEYIYESIGLNEDGELEEE